MRLVQKCIDQFDGFLNYRDEIVYARWVKVFSTSGHSEIKQQETLVGLSELQGQVGRIESSLWKIELTKEEVSKIIDPLRQVLLIEKLALAVGSSTHLIANSIEKLKLLRGQLTDEITVVEEEDIHEILSLIGKLEEYFLKMSMGADKELVFELLIALRSFVTRLRIQGPDAASQTILQIVEIVTKYKNKDVSVSSKDAIWDLVAPIYSKVVEIGKGVVLMNQLVGIYSVIIGETVKSLPK